MPNRCSTAKPSIRKRKSYAIRKRLRSIQRERRLETCLSKKSITLIRTMAAKFPRSSPLSISSLLSIGESSDKPTENRIATINSTIPRRYAFNRPRKRIAVFLSSLVIFPLIPPHTRHLMV